MARFDSLNTPGGHLAILLFLTLLMGGSGVWMMIRFGPTVPSVALIIGSFQNAFGALLLMLRGGDNAPPPPPPPITQIQVH
jgi:hypothetical protein